MAVKEDPEVVVRIYRVGKGRALLGECWLLSEIKLFGLGLLKIRRMQS